MGKYKRDDVEAMVSSLNEKLGPNSQLELDHAACYGGYCLTFADSHRATPRMPIREIYQYLQGALDWVTPDRA
tara:strand:+ start:459 stop:677 length:219 start_codon:yes stop_codon:yes gene_type:complete